MAHGEINHIEFPADDTARAEQIDPEGSEVGLVPGAPAS